MNQHLKQLNLKLGRRVDHGGLDAIPRALSRKDCPLPAGTTGFDLWNAYEVSFLLPDGKPEVYHLQAQYSADSPNMVESKSFKLFLNSFNDQVFDHVSTFKAHIAEKLSACVAGPVSLHFFSPETSPTPRSMAGICLDKLHAENYPKVYTPDLLKRENSTSRFKFYSHLLRTLCPVTGQPDWGTVAIEGSGPYQPVASDLLAYLIGYRNHQDFHETCCETIFSDLYQFLDPGTLRVSCHYTRRGGLDINPVRARGALKPFEPTHVWRQ